MGYIDAEELKERVTELIASTRQKDWPIAEYYLKSVIDIIDSLHQEQTEVDLEKEVEKFCLEYDSRKEVWFDMTPRDKKMLSIPTWSNFAANIARHFYELGKKGNKELNKKSKGSNDSDMGSPWRNRIIEEL